MSPNEQIFSSLFEFAYFPKWPNNLKDLSSIAKSEKWNKDSELYWILDNYLRELFVFILRVKQSAITYTDDKTKAYFATNLYSSKENSHHMIFAMFSKNDGMKNKKEFAPPYIFDKWCTYDEIQNIPNLPVSINFYHEEDTYSTADIFFPTIPIIDSVEYIASEVRRVLISDENFDHLIPSKNLKLLPNLIHDSICQVRMNRYRAVPCVDELSQISFLLPIYYPDDIAPSFTIVLKRMYTGTLGIYPEELSKCEYIYIGCLPIEMAYIQARLYSHIESPWLLQAQQYFRSKPMILPYSPLPSDYMTPTYTENGGVITPRGGGGALTYSTPKSLYATPYGSAPDILISARSYDNLDTVNGQVNPMRTIPSTPNMLGNNLLESINLQKNILRTGSSQKVSLKGLSGLVSELTPSNLITPTNMAQTKAIKITPLGELNRALAHYQERKVSGAVNTNVSAGIYQKSSPSISRSKYAFDGYQNGITTATSTTTTKRRQSKNKGGEKSNLHVRIHTDDSAATTAVGVGVQETYGDYNEYDDEDDDMDENESAYRLDSNNSNYNFSPAAGSEDRNRESFKEITPRFANIYDAPEITFNENPSRHNTIDYDDPEYVIPPLPSSSNNPMINNTTTYNTTINTTNAISLQKPTISMKRNTVNPSSSINDNMNPMRGGSNTTTTGIHTRKRDESNVSELYTEDDGNSTIYHEQDIYHEQQPSSSHPVRITELLDDDDDDEEDDDKSFMTSQSINRMKSDSINNVSTVSDLNTERSEHKKSRRVRQSRSHSDVEISTTYSEYPVSTLDNYMMKFPILTRIPFQETDKNEQYYVENDENVPIEIKEEVAAPVRNSFSSFLFSPRTRTERDLMANSPAKDMNLSPESLGSPSKRNEAKIKKAEETTRLLSSFRNKILATLSNSPRLDGSRPNSPPLSGKQQQSTTSYFSPSGTGTGISSKTQSNKANNDIHQDKSSITSEDEVMIDERPSPQRTPTSSNKSTSLLSQISQPFSLKRPQPPPPPPLPPLSQPQHKLEINTAPSTQTSSVTSNVTAINVVSTGGKQPSVVYLNPDDHPSPPPSPVPSPPIVSRKTYDEDHTDAAVATAAALALSTKSYPLDSPNESTAIDTENEVDVPTRGSIFRVLTRGLLSPRLRNNTGNTSPRPASVRVPPLQQTVDTSTPRSVDDNKTSPHSLGSISPKTEETNPLHTSTRSINSTTAPPVPAVFINILTYPGPYYTYEEIVQNKVPELDIYNKEKYLNDSDFMARFQMTKATYMAQPQWKREAQKKMSGLHHSSTGMLPNVQPFRVPSSRIIAVPTLPVTSSSPPSATSVTTTTTTPSAQVNVSSQQSIDQPVQEKTSATVIEKPSIVESPAVVLSTKSGVPPPPPPPRSRAPSNGSTAPSSTAPASVITPTYEAEVSQTKPKLTDRFTNFLKRSSIRNEEELTPPPVIPPSSTNNYANEAIIENPMRGQKNTTSVNSSIDTTEDRSRATSNASQSSRYNPFMKSTPNNTTLPPTHNNGINGKSGANNTSALETVNNFTTNPLRNSRKLNPPSRPVSVDNSAGISTALNNIPIHNTLQMSHDEQSIDDIPLKSASTESRASSIVSARGDNSSSSYKPKKPMMTWNSEPVNDPDSDIIHKSLTEDSRNTDNIYLTKSTDGLDEESDIRDSIPVNSSVLRDSIPQVSPRALTSFKAKKMTSWSSADSADPDTTTTSTTNNMNNINKSSSSEISIVKEGVMSTNITSNNNAPDTARKSTVTLKELRENMINNKSSTTTTTSNTINSISNGLKVQPIVPTPAIITSSALSPSVSLSSTSSPSSDASARGENGFHMNTQISTGNTVVSSHSISSATTTESTATNTTTEKKVYTYAELMNDKSIVSENKEELLNDEDFTKVLGMSRVDFAALPKWRKDVKKKAAKLN